MRIVYSVDKEAHTIPIVAIDTALAGHRDRAFGAGEPVAGAAREAAQRARSSGV